MRFKELRSAEKNNDKALTEEYKSAHSFGAVAAGRSHLFIKKGLSVYYIAYGDADRIFRRIRCVNAQMCCDNGEIEFEYLVVSDGKKELIEVQLPGKKAARMLMDELKEIAPETEFSAP